MKRSLDIIISVFLLIALFPFFMILLLLVWGSVGWPLLFIQPRAGFKGRTFNIIKLRTMKNLYDKQGNISVDELRITTMGRYLRSSSIDELPNLWNVLCGNMSLVGPRPLLLEYLPLYSDEQFRRHDVKPGITGWAQINGRNAINWEEKFKLDVWYVDNQSFLLDLKILLITVKKVVFRNDISADGHVTMEKFKG